MISSKVALVALVVALAGLPPSAAAASGPSMASSSSTAAVPESIDSTGETDVTASLQAYIDSVPDGSTITFQPGGRYRVEGTLFFKDRNRLTFEGQGATVFATTPGDRGRRHWQFAGGSAIVFRELNVKGAHPNGGTADAAYDSTKEAQHGFDFAGVDGVELDRVQVTDVYGDFVYLGAFVQRNLWNRNVWIHDSTFARNGRQGIAITGATGVRIERNDISEVRRATFDLEPNGPGWGVDGVLISDNQIGSGRLLFIAAHGDGPVNNITVADNELRGKAMVMNLEGDEGAVRHGLRITGNVSDVGYGNNGFGVIGVTRYDDVTVQGNVQRLQRDRNMVGVHARDVCNLNVSGNTFEHAVAEYRQVGSRLCTPDPVVPTACPSDQSQDSTFRDIDGSVHEAAIVCLSRYALVQGVAADRFEPGGTLTRAQTATVLANLIDASQTILPAEAPDLFADDNGSVHEASINRLAAVGVIRGRSPGAYEPGAEVKRDQLAALAVRAHAYITGRELPPAPDAFDDDQTSVHQADIDAAAAQGWILGVQPRVFDPVADITRGQASSVVARLLSSLVDAGAVLPRTAS